MMKARQIDSGHNGGGVGNSDGGRDNKDDGNGDVTSAVEFQH